MVLHIEGLQFSRQLSLVGVYPCTATLPLQENVCPLFTIAALVAAVCQYAK